MMMRVSIGLFAVALIPAMVGCKTKTRGSSLQESVGENSSRPFGDQVQMNIERLKVEAFKRCQGKFGMFVEDQQFGQTRQEIMQRRHIDPAKVNIRWVPAVDELDPPKDGQDQSVGMVFWEGNLLAAKQDLVKSGSFALKALPRAGGSKFPGSLYVANAPGGTYGYYPWDPNNLDMREETVGNVVHRIVPSINLQNLPEGGRTWTGMNGWAERAPGDWSGMFDIRTNAYGRFVTMRDAPMGASLRFAVHGICGMGGFAETDPKVDEDFAQIDTFFVAPKEGGVNNVMAIVENNQFCGALDIDVAPGMDKTNITVDSYWFARENYDWWKDPNTGLVAYSSFYWKQDSDTAETNDGAHDSDHLQVRLENGQTPELAMSLPAPGHLGIVDYPELPKKKGDEIQQPRVMTWTLQQRDRDPSHYWRYGTARYADRLNHEVEILPETTVRTGVRYYIFPTDVEYTDNVVVASTLRQDIPKATSPDQAVRFRYRTSAYK